MKAVSRNRNEIVVALALFLINIFVAVRIVGLSYSHFTWQAFALAYGTGEGGLGDASCHDGIDNDHNGLIDCADPQCFGTPSCTKRTPALSWSSLATLLVVLVSTGWLSLARHRRHAD